MDRLPLALLAVLLVLPAAAQDAAGLRLRLEAPGPIPFGTQPTVRVFVENPGPAPVTLPLPCEVLPVSVRWEVRPVDGSEPQAVLGPATGLCGDVSPLVPEDLPELATGASELPLETRRLRLQGQFVLTRPGRYAVRVSYEVHPEVASYYADLIPAELAERWRAAWHGRLVSPWVELEVAAPSARVARLLAGAEALRAGQGRGEVVARLGRPDLELAPDPDGESGLSHRCERFWYSLAPGLPPAELEEWLGLHRLVVDLDPANGRVIEVWRAPRHVPARSTEPALTLVEPDPDARGGPAAYRAALSPDARLAAFGTAAGVGLWSLEPKAGRADRLGILLDQWVEALAFAPTGRWLFAATDRGELLAWDLTDLHGSLPEPTSPLEGQPLRVSGLRFVTAAGRTSAVLYGEGVRIAPLEGGTRLGSNRFLIRREGDAVVAVSARGVLVAASYGPIPPARWRDDPLDEEDDAVGDGDYALGDGDHAPRLVLADVSSSPARTLAEVRDWGWEYDSASEAAAFDAAERRLITGRTGAAAVWSLEPTGELLGLRLLARLPHDDRVAAVAFTPAGDHVILVGDDGARLWQLEPDGRASPGETWPGAAHALSLSLSADGRWALTGGHEGAHLWRLPGP